MDKIYWCYCSCGKGLCILVKGMRCVSLAKMLDGVLLAGMIILRCTVAHLMVITRASRCLWQHPVCFVTRKGRKAKERTGCSGGALCGGRSSIAGAANASRHARGGTMLCYVLQRLCW